LLSLGYSELEAEKALADLDLENLDLSAAIKLAIKRLASPS